MASSTVYGRSDPLNKASRLAVVAWLEKTCCFATDCRVTVALGSVKGNRFTHPYVLCLVTNRHRHRPPRFKRRAQGAQKLWLCLVAWKEKEKKRQKYRSVPQTYGPFPFNVYIQTRTKHGKRANFTRHTYCFFYCTIFSCVLVLVVLIARLVSRETAAEAAVSHDTHHVWRSGEREDLSNRGYLNLPR